ncbi:hypothetical protein PR048_016317 [Dryococelus australis]|uniref:DDE Tnp4 domain-containing protein n=1 Tax=Dryococelus australis TaxID=614101 RepID=A0ABQ9HJD5_9NEOP|nr:hypothetical protein PR048_016317 [Dryococelus australis]
MGIPTLFRDAGRIVMMAIADANYNFIYVDVGSQGRISDGGVFRRTELYSKLQNGDLDLRPDVVLPGIDENVPYVFLAGDAFPLQRNTMKPYPGTFEKNSPKRIYNHRLCRPRRVIENTSGIMAWFLEFFESLCFCNSKMLR